MIEFIKEHLNINKTGLPEEFVEVWHLTHFAWGIVTGLFFKEILPKIKKPKLNNCSILFYSLLISITFEIIENADASLGNKYLFGATHPDYSGDNPIDSQMDNLYFLLGTIIVLYSNLYISLLILFLTLGYVAIFLFL